MTIKLLTQLEAFNKLANGSHISNIKLYDKEAFIKYDPYDKIFLLVYMPDRICSQEITVILDPKELNNKIWFEVNKYGNIDNE